MLAPVGPGGSGEYLPVLWDLERDRAARARAQPMPAGGVLLVPGALLQGVGLPFDVVVHLRVSPAARRRLTPPEQAWELPAFDRYDDEVDPAGLADAVVLPTIPTAPPWCSAGASAELAGHPAVEDVPGDRHRRRQRRRAVAARSSSRVNQRASSISRRVEHERVGAVGARDEAEHERLRERPRLAADVADVGDPQPDLLGDLAGDRRLGRLPRLDEAGEDREPAGRPDRLPAEHHRSPPSWTSMITAGSVRGKISVPVVGSRCTQPARSIVVAAPLSGLNRCRSCHSRIPIAWTSSPASRSSRSAPTSRSPAHASTDRPLTVSARSPRTAAYGTPSASPRYTAPRGSSGCSSHTSSGPSAAS